MAAIAKGKDLKDIDIDGLLSKLSAAELEDLQNELIDPEESAISPSDRCKYKLSKEPTGPFDREKLLEYLEDKAKNEKDWEEAKPYIKETRGKLYEPKEEKKLPVAENIKIGSDWDEVLAKATPEELADLAALLGFHGVLNQPQYHHAFEDKDRKRSKAVLALDKNSEFKIYPQEAPNSTDVEKSLQQVKRNDPALRELNLNNIKGITIDQLCEFGEALTTNTHLEKLHLANTMSNDKVAKAFAAGLFKNKTLKLLNLESNYISGTGIIELLEAINANQAVSEFRVANQRPQILGVKIETEIAELIRRNTSLLRFGIFLEARNARVVVTDCLKRNNDNLRRGRVGEEIIRPTSEVRSPLVDEGKAEAVHDQSN